MTEDLLYFEKSLIPAAESRLEITRDKLPSSNVIDHVTTRISDYFGFENRGQLLGQFSQPP